MRQGLLRIAFDDQIFIAQRYGGISRYFSSLVREMQRLDGVEAKIIAPLHRNYHASLLGPGSIYGANVSAIPKAGPFLRTITPLIATFAIASFRPNITHETYYAPSPRRHDNTSRVVTVFDMIHELFPEQFRADTDTTRNKRLAVKRADHVLCISKQTQSDLINIFDVDPSKTTVIHLGFDSLGSKTSQNKIATSTRHVKPFILYVGLRGGYKNFFQLIKAFVSSRKLMSGFRIICFGGGTFACNELQEFAELGLAPEDIEHQSGDDEQLAQAYQDAAVFVYPSLYEGFGIPPLEAMSLGCPVAASRTSSIPEVVGDAAELFDPKDTDSIGFAIESIVFSDTKRRALINAGYLRSRLFTWYNCAQNTVDVYRKL